MEQLKGNNSLGSKQIFSERKKYKQNIVLANSLDLWYNNPLYGKVDRNGFAVLLSETNLKQLKTEETIFVVDFVAEAFSDLQVFLSTSILRKRVLASKFLSSIKPETGWVSANNLYHGYMNVIYLMFVNRYIAQFNKDYKITSFENFVHEFYSFVKIMKLQPITKSQFLYSNICPNTVSGLIVEIARNLHDNDSAKQKFIESPDFYFWQRIVKKFGFYINKNNPFQIVFNVGSVKAHKYMSKYGILYKPGSASDLFDVYYYSVGYQQDIDVLKSYLIQFYNSYVSAKPFVLCSGKTHKRSAYTEKNNFNDLYWVKLYTIIRLLENVFDIKWEEVLKKTEQALDLYVNVGKREYVLFLEQEIRNNGI